MNIQLHKNARTPPAIRLELQSQPESVSGRELAGAYHLPQRLHATAQEAVVVVLRETLLLPPGSTSNSSRTSQPPPPAVSSCA